MNPSTVQQIYNKQVSTLFSDTKALLSKFFLQYLLLDGETIPLN